MGRKLNLNFFERQKLFSSGDLIRGKYSYGIILHSLFEDYFGKTVPAGLEVLWANGSTQICWVDEIEKVV